MNMENKIVMVQESIKVLMRVYMRTPMLQYRKEKIRFALVKLFLLYTKLSKDKFERRMWVRPIYSIEQRLFKETMPEKEELPQESEVHHNDFDEGEDGQTEESYDDPPIKKKSRNKQDRRWLEADEILITAVQMKPCLWNHTIDVKKRSTLNVSKAWIDVLKELKDYKFTLEEVKRRWRNLRDSFNKAKKKKTIYLPSGSATPTTNDDSSFRHYESMLFLTDKVKPRPTKSNISKKKSHSCDSNEASISTVSDDITIEPMDSLSTSGINSNISENSSFIEHTKHPRKKHEDVESQKQLVNILSECNKPDGIDGFLVLLGDILKRLPYKERRALQKEILDSAYKAEEEAGFI